MPGSLNDLGQAGVRLPTEVIVDTNLIVTRFLAPYLANASPLSAAQVNHSTWFFGEVKAERTMGFVTPRVLDEVLHVQIKNMFANDIAAYLPHLMQYWPNITQASRFKWFHLFKARPQNLRQYAQDLAATVNDLINFGLFLVQPWELDEMGGNSWEDEMVRRIRRYETDAGDTCILVEAQRAGISNIATLDKDFRNARQDFHIYTWL
jgi:predicted nucleic acid-binding protein